MVTVCAWCERYLGSTMDAGPMNHGICIPCSVRQRWVDTPIIVVARHRAEMIPVLEQLLRGEPAIQVVIDRRVGDRRRREGDPDRAGERRRGPDRRQRPADAVFV